MVHILVVLILIGIVYFVAKALLPEPIPFITVLLLSLFFVIIPLLRGY